MKLKVKDMDIATGGVEIVILNEKDAALLDMHHMDRVLVKKGSKSTIAVLNIAESKRAVPQGRVGFFEETIDVLNAKSNDAVEIFLAKKPESVSYIKKKLDGKELSYKETFAIVNDIVSDNLTSIELTSYVIANYTKGMTQREIVDLTKAMKDTGNKLELKDDIIVDLHSIGGVPGNRITMIIVPIIIAAGLKMPKTSSRAITSPAGTADTMEVFCNVDLPINKIKSIINTVGGFIIWGGAVNLAPADDKIIKIEHPLSIDAEGQMLASIMAKKSSVGATHLLLEIPIGRGTKIADEKQASHLKDHFIFLGQELGIKTVVISTDGSQPIGNGIGPVLEAIDVLKVLKNENDLPNDLKVKSISIAGLILEMVGRVKEGEGCIFATELIDSGKAYKKFVEMVHAQGGKTPDIKKLRPAKFSYNVKALKNGRIKSINNLLISKIARIAGAPNDKAAGLYLYKHVGEVVKKGDKLFTVYSEGKEKLNYAIQASKEDHILIK